MQDFFFSLAAWYKRYERGLSLGALVGGFIIDNVTLQRIDLLFENAILLFYLSVAGATILFMNFYQSRQLEKKVYQWLYLFAPLLLQFAFGGLFSGFVIFYFRSASIAASWPFLLFLVIIFIGNELFVKQFARMTFQVSIFYIAVFSFSIFYIPIVLSKLGTGVFLLSGIVSLAVIGLFVWVVAYLYREQFERSKQYMILVIVLIYISITGAYFLNLIPPIPLSVKEMKLAYSVERVNDEYHVMHPQNTWYYRLLPTRSFKVAEGQPLYFYSAVFAPTDITTPIVHEWQLKNNDGDWETRSRITFPIVGGADGGYRGYSVKRVLEEGMWRINIETERGQTLGRRVFSLVYDKNISPLVETRY